MIKLTERLFEESQDNPDDDRWQAADHIEHLEETVQVQGVLLAQRDARIKQLEQQAVERTLHNNEVAEAQEQRIEHLERVLVQSKGALDLALFGDPSREQDTLVEQAIAAIDEALKEKT